MPDLKLDHPPRRVVSLVPSLTESLFDLDMGHVLVGVTNYCIHPAQKLASLPRIGGPKNPDPAAIIRLQPDLVLANQEENTPGVVEQLEAAGIPVWVSFPKTAREAVEILWQLIEAFQLVLSGFKVTMLERALEWAEASLETSPPLKVFCPIWMDDRAGQPWWMTSIKTPMPTTCCGLPVARISLLTARAVTPSMPI